MTDGAMLTEILAALEIPCDKCSFHGKLDALAAGLGIDTEGRLLGDVLDDIAAKEGIQRDNRLYGAFIRKLYDYVTNGEDVTLTGNPLVLANSMGRPLKECVVSWEPTQDGEGTPYPAGGGKNLLDMAQCKATEGKPYGLTITIDGDIIKASGIPSSEVTEERQYSFAVASCAQTELRGKGYKVTAFAIKGKVSSAWGLRTENEDNLAIAAKLTPGVDTDIQFRLMVSKDTPAAYAPYANIRPIKGRDSISITRQEDELSMPLTLPLTIYGGEVDAQTGEGLWAWRLITLDGTENWKRDSSGGTAFICNIDGIENRAENSKMVCSHAAWGTTSPTANYRVNTIAYTLYLVWPNADGDAVKLRELLAAQYAAGTPVQIAYKLATPVPFTASGGGTIPTVKGTNTLLTDADTIKATYRCNVHAAEQELDTLYTDLLQELEE